MVAVVVFSGVGAWLDHFFTYVMPARLGTAQLTPCLPPHCRLPLNDPRRFRVQILFSPGAAYNPVELSPPNHTLPIAPRKPVHYKGRLVWGD